MPHKLVIGGGYGWMNKHIYTYVEELGLSDNVRFIGYIDDEDMAGIYSLADVFVFPSFYEGFGFPVLEAMACGTPVITSNNSSLSEIGGDAVIYVDPHSEDEIAESIYMLITNNEIRNRCIQRGFTRKNIFSWEKAAKSTIETFENLM
ncbi:group 1 glycosyl transferase [Candidatus Magnetoovum chiemensis]|nr:group 1 glycosyl transferase [Candidatus Magnetoovum chiemensis]